MKSSNIKDFMKILVYLAAVIHGSEVLAFTKIELTQSENNLVLEGEVIVRKVTTKDKKGRTFEAIGLINATVDEVYQVLIRFEDYSTFMPNVSKIEILKSDVDYAILNYTIILPLGKIKYYRLRITFEKNDGTAMLKWKMLNWPGLKESETIEDTTGYWLVKNYPEKKGHVIVLYHVYTDTGHIPMGLGWIADILSKNSVPDVVIKTRDHVHKLYKKSERKLDAQILEDEK